MTFRRNLAAIIHIAVVMACASVNGLSLTDLAKKIRPATLLLLVCGQDGKIIASGTGFLVSSDGLLVTNKHVINGGSHISAKAENGNTYKVIGIAAGAEHHDVVILKIEAANLPFLAFGDSDAVEVGQQVAIIGNPLGWKELFRKGLLLPNGSSKGNNGCKLLRQFLLDRADRLSLILMER